MGNKPKFYSKFILFVDRLKKTRMAIKKSTKTRIKTKRRKKIRKIRREGSNPESGLLFLIFLTEHSFPKFSRKVIEG